MCSVWTDGRSDTRARPCAPICRTRTPPPDPGSTAYLGTGAQEPCSPSPSGPPLPVMPPHRRPPSLQGTRVTPQTHRPGPLLGGQLHPTVHAPPDPGLEVLHPGVGLVPAAAAHPTPVVPQPRVVVPVTGRAVGGCTSGLLPASPGRLVGPYLRSGAVGQVLDPVIQGVGVEVPDTQTGRQGTEPGRGHESVAAYDEGPPGAGGHDDGEGVVPAGSWPGEHHVRVSAAQGPDAALVAGVVAVQARDGTPALGGVHGLSVWFGAISRVSRIRDLVGA